MPFEEACKEELLASCQEFKFDTPVTIYVTDHYVIINPGHCHALRITEECGKMVVEDWWGWGKG